MRASVGFAPQQHRQRCQHSGVREQGQPEVGIVSEFRLQGAEQTQPDTQILQFANDIVRGVALVRPVNCFSQALSGQLAGRQPLHALRISRVPGGESTPERAAALNMSSPSGTQALPKTRKTAGTVTLDF